MKLIDNHCHLTFQAFDEDRDAVVERCMEKLDAVVNAGSAPWQDPQVLELAEQYPGFVYPCIGMHPIKLDRVDEEDLEAIEETIRDRQEDIVAVGEIGLDYFHAKETEERERQEEFFIPLLELAEDIDMPVVIHSRDAEKRVVEILEEFSPPEVIMHCFNGNMQVLEECVDRGYWISVSTQILYSTRVKNIVENTPVDQMMLETDAPFLYPGDERNEPWRIHESLERIAEIKGIDEQELAEQVNRNTRDAYSTEF